MSELPHEQFSPWGSRPSGIEDNREEIPIFKGLYALLIDTPLSLLLGGVLFLHGAARIATG